MNKSRNVETILVASVVAFYIISALVMIFVNKAVLNSSPILPFLFLFLQMFIAVVLLHIAALISSKVTLPSRSELTLTKVKQLTPVVFVNIVGLVFNTLCLRDVDASFFQIARGLVLPLTIVVSSLSTHTRPTLLVLLCATLVTTGFLIGVLPPSLFTFSPTATATLPIFSTTAPETSRIISLIYGILSSLFIALHAVLIKTSLPHVDGSTLKLAWWTNLGSALFLVPCIFIAGEPGKVQGLLKYGIDINGEVGGWGTWQWKTFVVGSVVTGVFGFLLCVAGLLSIKVTSPITHMFSSAAKGVLQTLLGVSIFHDILTVTRASSVFVILSGTVLYTWVKSQEHNSARGEATSSTSTPIMMQGKKDSEGTKEEREEFIERGRNQEP